MPKEATPESVLAITLANVRNPNHSDARATRCIVILLESDDEDTNYTVKRCGLREDELLDVLAMLRADIMPVRH